MMMRKHIVQSLQIPQFPTHSLIVHISLVTFRRGMNYTLTCRLESKEALKGARA